MTESVSPKSTQVGCSLLLLDLVLQFLGQIRALPILRTTLSGGLSFGVAARLQPIIPVQIENIHDWYLNFGRVKLMNQPLATLRGTEKTEAGTLTGATFTSSLEIPIDLPIDVRSGQRRF